MARLRVLRKYARKIKYWVFELHCRLSIVRWGFLMCLFRIRYERVRIKFCLIN